MARNFRAGRKRPAVGIWTCPVCACVWHWLGGEPRAAGRVTAPGSGSKQSFPRGAAPFHPNQQDWLGNGHGEAEPPTVDFCRYCGYSTQGGGWENAATAFSGGCISPAAAVFSAALWIFLFSLLLWVYLYVP